MWVRLNRRKYWVRGCSGIGKYFLHDKRFCRFHKCPPNSPNSLGTLDVAVGDRFEELGDDRKPVWTLVVRSDDDLEMLARKYVTMFAIADLD